MTLKEIRVLDHEGLKSKVKELREELFWLKFKNKSGMLDAPSNLRKTRRQLATVLTVLREKSGTVGEENTHE